MESDSDDHTGERIRTEGKALWQEMERGITDAITEEVTRALLQTA